MRGSKIMTFSSGEIEIAAPGLDQFLNDAFEGDFSAEDFEHCMGGQHFVVLRDSQLLAHGSVVSRKICFDDLRLDVGYVEALAVRPDWRGRGVGSDLLAELTTHCQTNFGVSMLSTDRQAFYERHGWRRIAGESFVETDSGLVRTADEDEGLMVLTDLAVAVQARQVICDFRNGDVW